MTWIQFTMWMTIIYLIYYGLNILIDGAKGGNNDDGILTDNYLTFSEDIKPQILDENFVNEATDEYNEEIEFAGSSSEDDDAIFISENAIAFTGGVSIKHVFNLAKTEMIEFTRPVIFER
ncbi:hypothetical protein ACVWYG_003748 [Pedobacter sp. UYEF25]